MVFEALKLRHPRSEELHKPFEQLLAPHLKDPMQLHHELSVDEPYGLEHDSDDVAGPNHRLDVALVAQPPAIVRLHEPAGAREAALNNRVGQPTGSSQPLTNSVNTRATLCPSSAVSEAREADDIGGSATLLGACTGAGTDAGRPDAPLLGASSWCIFAEKPWISGATAATLMSPSALRSTAAAAATAASTASCTVA